jgi:hypothetical protein
MKNDSSKCTDDIQGREDFQCGERNWEVIIAGTTESLSRYESFHKVLKTFSSSHIQLWKIYLPDRK